MVRSLRLYLFLAAALVGINGAALNEAGARAKDLVGVLGGPSADDALAQLKSMTNMSIEKFLTESKKIADDLLDRGANAGSLLEIQAANEMTNFAFTLRSQFANEMDRQVSAASAQIMPVLVELQRWRGSLEKFNSSLFGLEDLIALDMGDALIVNIPLSVRRVYGGVFVQGRPETYYIDLVGQHFGGAEGIETTFKVTLDGQAISAPKLVPPHEAVFSIPASAIEAKFDKEKIVVLPLDIVVTRKTTHWWDRFDVFGLFRDIKTVPVHYHVSLLAQEVGSLTVITEYPRYEWQPLQDVVPQITVVNSAQALGPYESPSPVKNGVPVRLSTKIDPKSVEVKCVPEMGEARDFGNGRVLPAAHEAFTKGFRSANNCGSRGDRDAAIASIRSQFKALFNIEKALSCSEGEYGWLTPAELLGNSKPVQMDISGCRNMQYDRDIQWTPDGVGFRVRLVGVPLDPAKTFFDSTDRTASFAKWRVTYQSLTYEATGKTDSEPDQKISVTESTPISFKVADYLGGSSIRLVFAPRIGQSVTRQAGDQLGRGLRPVGVPKRIGNQTEYLYEFKYPDLNLPHLRAVDGLPP